MSRTRMREVNRLSGHSRIVSDGFFYVEQRIQEILRDSKHQQRKADDLHKSGNYDPDKHTIYLEHVIENVERLRKSILALRKCVFKEM